MLKVVSNQILSFSSILALSTVLLGAGAVPSFAMDPEPSSDMDTARAHQRRVIQLYRERATQEESAGNATHLHTQGDRIQAMQMVTEEALKQ